MNVNVNKVSWSVVGQRIIKSIDLKANLGEVVGLIGPNGSGKSSLLRLIYRFLTPDVGCIQLGERDISLMNTKELARNLAVVTQERTSGFDSTVHEMVMMGRNPHKKLLDPDTKKDETIVRQALKYVGISPLANRDFNTLSGGEKQRVLVALALAQQPRVLVLDEPTNHLDLRYQFEIMELIRSLGITTIVAMHDLNHAATYCDRVYLLNKGCVVAEGTPQEVLTAKRIRSVYGVNVAVGIHPLTRNLNIVFIGNNQPK